MWEAIEQNNLVDKKMTWNVNTYLENKNNELYIEGVASTKLVEQFSTPLYVLSESRIREQYRKIYNALRANYEKIRIYYSAKANTNLSVLNILRSEGSFLDVVSCGEVFLALKAGFNPEHILFTGTNVKNEELLYLLDKNVIINIDSLSLLHRLLQLTVPEIISFRINPEVGAGHHQYVITAGKKSKFGLCEKDILKAYAVAQKSGVDRFGIHMHIGAGNLLVEPFALALEKLLEIVVKIKIELGIEFEFIDIGGGFGVPYKPEEKEFDLNQFSKNILASFEEKIIEYDLGEPFFSVEPGRYIVCDAGVLLTKVNTLKTTPYKKYIGIDAGFNTLVRPIMYGSYHHILAANRLNDEEQELYDVAGPICESGDLLAIDRKLPMLQEGDILAVLNSGAYGYSMSSNYNSRPRCAEILVRNGERSIVREGETFDDLASKQRIAEWLV